MQTAADKEGRLIVRQAYKAGRKVTYSLSRLIELKLTLKVIRAVYGGPTRQAQQPGT